MTKRLFWENPYQVEFDATVTKVIGNSVVLETFQVTNMDVSGLWSWLIEGIKKLIEGLLKFLGAG